MTNRNVNLKDIGRENKSLDFKLGDFIPLIGMKKFFGRNDLEFEQYQGLGLSGKIIGKGAILTLYNVGLAFYGIYSAIESLVN